MNKNGQKGEFTLYTTIILDDHENQFEKAKDEEQMRNSGWSGLLCFPPPSKDSESPSPLISFHSKGKGDAKFII